MVIGFRGIPKITFPVFLLDSGNWEEYDGLLFLDNMILDDKNQQGKTLGARRVQTPHKNLQVLKRMKVPGLLGLDFHGVLLISLINPEYHFVLPDSSSWPMCLLLLLFVAVRTMPTY